MPKEKKESLDTEPQELRETVDLLDQLVHQDLRDLPVLEERRETRMLCPSREPKDHVEHQAEMEP